MYRKPSSSRWPRSPVRNQPSAERLPVRLRIVVVAGKDRRAADADLAGLTGRDLAPLVVLELHLHSGALESSGADLHARAVSGACRAGAAP